MRSMKSDLIVVGGGAAGMLAAGFAAKRGLDTILIERNEFTGRKLGITGKGRCNVTNNTSPKDVIANIPTNGKFLYSALDAFTPADVMNFFESLGVPLKTERGGRVFPESDKAADIVNALRRFDKANGVRTICGRVTDIMAADGHVRGVATGTKEFRADNVILCTGGMSYPATGSTGDGYVMARRLGHTINTPRPSLVSLVEDGDICRSMQGFTLKNVRLSVFDGSGKLVFEDFGEMLFTHVGVSGPLVLSASAHMRDFNKEKYRLSIDLKPALDEQKLDNRILRDFAQFSNRNFANALDKLAGKSMIPTIIRLSGIPPDTKVNSVTREQRHRLVELFKNFPVPIAGPGSLDEAIITSGGVEPKEINPRTLESKLQGGLYFAGEIIDVDAYTGGYNLQIAWSTAYTAAKNIPFPIGGDS